MVFPARVPPPAFVIAQLSGIVSVIDFFVGGGTAYLVMEFLTGQSFASFLSAQDHGRDEVGILLQNLIAQSPRLAVAIVPRQMNRTEHEMDEAAQHDGFKS